MAQRAKRVIGGILFSIALVAFLAFIFLLFVEAENVESVPGVDDITMMAIAIGIALGAIALVLVLLLISRRKDRPAEAEGEVYFISGAQEEGPARSAPAPVPEQSWSGEPHRPPSDIVVHDLTRVPLILRSWSVDETGHEVYSYPCNVQNAVYSNDYIEVAPDLALKLRTMLAGPADIAPYIIHEPTSVDDDAQPWQPEEAWEPETWEPEETETVDEPARPERPPRRRGSDDIMSELEKRFGAGQR